MSRCRSHLVSAGRLAGPSFLTAKGGNGPSEVKLVTCRLGEVGAKIEDPYLRIEMAAEKHHGQGKGGETGGETGRVPRGSRLVYMQMCGSV